MHLLSSLILVFFKIGLFSIGGGYAIIPLIQAQVVNQYGWISLQTFTDIITISQMTPGPLAVNTSTFIGIQIAGIPGAILATVGCVSSGICISTILYRFFQKHKESTYVFQVLNALKASSVGLIISAAVTILILAFWGNSDVVLTQAPDWIAVLLFLGAFIAVRKWKINPILMLVITGILGAIAYL